MGSDNHKIIIEEYGTEEKSFHVFINGHVILLGGSLQDLMLVLFCYLKGDYTNACNK